MASARSPHIGNWYLDPTEDLYFEVVAIDNDTGFIAIQYIDGEVGELDKELWREIHPMNAAPPKDGDAAFELSHEDHFIDGNFENEIWVNPVEQIEAELFQGFDDY